MTAKPADNSQDVPGSGKAPAAGRDDFMLVEMELEREKIALERERLAHEREKLALERMRLRSDSDLYRRKHRYALSPAMAVLIALVFLLAGLGIGGFALRRRGIEMSAKQLESPVILKSAADGSEREATAYVLFVK